MILSVFRRSFQGDRIAALYGAIVAQSRLPAFYLRYGVADSVEGRFELIVLHLVLVLRRLEGETTGHGVPPAQGRSDGQRLFDAFCRDLDDNLREMGVGDMAVPRRMRGFGEAFYGRQAAYVAALASPELAVLEKAMARNILGSNDAPEKAAALARYARALVRQLDSKADADLVAGNVDFPAPEAFANA